MALFPLGILSAAGAVLGRIAVAGYASGGNLVGGSQSSTVDKLSFPNETSSTLGTGLSRVAYFAAGFTNSGVAGYIAGGESNGTPVTTVDKFAFPADTRTTLGTGMSAASNGGSGFANSGVAGYATRGNFTTVVDKFAFPGDSRTTLGTGLTGNRAYGATAENAAVAGYYAGGDGGGSAQSNIDKFSFPSDTRSAVSGGLASAIWYSSVGLSNNAVAIYFQSDSSTTFNKFALPSDTRSTFSAGTTARPGGAQMSSSGVAGYIGGGQDPSNRTTAITKLSFVNDSVSNIGAVLSSARTGQAGMSDQGVF